MQTIQSNNTYNKRSSHGIWLLSFFFIAFTVIGNAQCADITGTGDCDGDGIINANDLDGDNDGILDVDEGKNAVLVNNPSFEQPGGVTPGRITIVDESVIPYWSTTATDNKIEIWGTGHIGFGSHDGGHHAELNAFEVSSLFQDIAIPPGTTLEWSIAHRGRAGTDTATVSIGAPGSQLSVVQTMSTGNSSWVVYTGTYTVPLGQSTTRFSFNSISAAGGNPAIGNLLDNFSLESLGIDSDGDGTPNHLELDADNDGCIDTVEGGAGFTFADVDSDGRLLGAVDANGIPLAASGGQALGNAGNSSLIAAVCTGLDNDGDGVENTLDDYPNDPTKVANSYYPMKYFKATVAFEDLWPFIGDYDFNDTAIDYNITTVTNPQNLIVELLFEVILDADGGGFNNAFAFELEGIAPSAIQSISGQALTQGVFTLDANGTESGQTNAVIPVFDDDTTVLGQNLSVVVTLVSPLASVGTAPFDPFIVVNGDRQMEIHLIGNDPTDLGNATPTVTGANADVDGDYATDNGLPWAINIIDKIPLPVEKTPINEGFIYFNEWAQSGGTSRTDWYEDKTGYRVSTKVRLR